MLDYSKKIVIKKYSLILLLYAASIFVNSCSNKAYLKKINEYFNASTVNEKAKFMADNYHSYFIEVKGEGENKSDALRSFQNWDAPLHPQIDIIRYSVNKKTWTIYFNEQNDFSKLLAFPDGSNSDNHL